MDAQLVIAGMKALSEQFNCLVLVVSHTGHENDRQRGSSRWKQAWDVEILVKNNIITCTKAKFDKPFEPIGFEMQESASSIAVVPHALENLPDAYNVLAESEEPMTTKQIAEKLGFTKQAAQKQLDSLKERGLAGADKRGQTNYWTLRK
jgi:predicted HTH transcriptional regulator